MFSSFLNVGMSKIKTLGQMQQTRASLLLIGPLKSVINWGCAVRFSLPAKGLLSHRLMGWWWVTLSRLSINSQFPRNVSLFLALSILLYFQLFSNLNRALHGSRHITTISECIFTWQYIFISLFFTKALHSFLSCLNCVYILYFFADFN